MVGNTSVHLHDWPNSGEINQEIIEDMAKLRSYVNEALAVRAKNSVKIRQTLQSISVQSNNISEEVKQWMEPVLLEELNVKEVKWSAGPVELDLNITSELKSEGLMREVIRNIQNSRKKAGLNVDDRINLYLHSSNNELKEVYNKFVQEISKEVLATNFEDNLQDLEHNFEVKIESMDLKISLQKQ